MQSLTQKIFELSAPYANPYQGEYSRVLFVCSAGLLRSATAATIGAQMNLNCRSCGTMKDALIPLSLNLIAWADEIYFVNKENYIEASQTFNDYEFALDQLKWATVWSIPDIYPYMDPTLVEIITELLVQDYNT